MDAKYIYGKGLIACRDIKKDNFMRIDWIDYLLWMNDEMYGEEDDEN